MSGAWLARPARSVAWKSCSLGIPTLRAWFSALAIGERGVTWRGGEVGVPCRGEMAAEQDPEGRAAAQPLLTDLYQATMALGYWRAGRACDPAEFELFFRRCPFGGAFALAAGLRDCVRFLRAFRLRDAGTPQGPRPPARSPATRTGPSRPPRPARPAAYAGSATSFPRAHSAQPMPASRPQTCSSWPRCCHRTLTPRSSSTSGAWTAPG